MYALNVFALHPAVARLHLKTQIHLCVQTCWHDHQRKYELVSRYQADLGLLVALDKVD